MTTDELVRGASQWFGSLGSWPDESPEQIAKGNWGAKRDTASYYGVQAVLLMLIAANEGKWPPMSPRAFANGLPKTAEQIARYAKNVATTELRSEAHGRIP